LTVTAERDLELVSTDPRTGEVVGRVPAMGPDDVAAAVDRASTAAVTWGATPVADRARHLRRIRRAWIRHSRDLVSTVASETGKSRIDAAYEVLAVALNLDWCSWHAARALRPSRVSTFPMVMKRARIEHAPYGVVGVIAPWNYPAGIPMQVLPWVVAAGNTVVLKPSELTPMTGLLIGEVFNGAGVDLIEVVTGDGRAGAALAGSPGIAKIEFTGSGRTGRHVLAAAAENLTPVVMELGGKDAMIVTAGADVEAAARTAVAAAFFNAGQTCMATERVIVVDVVHDELVSRILAHTETLAVGDRPDALVGPLTLPGTIDRVLGRIEAASRAGATVAAGGRRSPGGGDVLEPTVLTDVPATCEILREENFAPVLCVVRVPDVDAAVTVANDVELGLSGSVFAGSRAEARSIASRLQTGSVIVGDAMVGAAIAGLPFGGEKGSGFGRLQGVAGFHEFSRQRAVVENRFGGGLMASMALRRPDPDRVLAAAEAGLGGGGPGRRWRLLRQALRR